MLLLLFVCFVFKNEIREMAQVRFAFRRMKVNVLCSIVNLDGLFLYVTLTWQPTDFRKSA